MNFFKNIKTAFNFNFYTVDYKKICFQEQFVQKLYLNLLILHGSGKKNQLLLFKIDLHRVQPVHKD